ERYQSVTPATVARAVGRWLDTPNRVVLRVHPENAVAPSAADIDRARKPPIGDDRPFTPPEVRSTKLASGLEVLVVERHDLPTVAAVLAMFAGPAFDPPGKEGRALLTANAAVRGTRRHDALALEDAFRALGGQLAPAAFREVASLSFQVLKPKLAPALGLLAEV